MATPATARALERGNALLRRDSAKSLTAKKGRSMASPINAPLSKLRALMRRRSISTYPRPASDNMVGQKAARSLRLGRNSFISVATEGLTPRMVQRAVLLPTFSTAIFFERIRFGRVPAVGLCGGEPSRPVALFHRHSGRLTVSRSRPKRGSAPYKSAPVMTTAPAELQD